MKKLIIALSILCLTGCTTQWEYKIVTVDNSTDSDFRESNFKVTSSDLDLFGVDGWELVNVYTITQTQHPNFGDDKYVTGIRENTRTESVNFVFKRKK